MEVVTVTAGRGLLGLNPAFELFKDESTVTIQAKGNSEALQMF